MNVTEETGAKNLIKELIEPILGNHKLQTLTATGTTGIAIDYHVLSTLPVIITIIGGSLGIVLTSLMIAHKWIQIKKELLDE